MFSTEAVLIGIPTNSAGRVPFSVHPHQCLFFLVFFILIMPVIYYTKRIQSRISEGERHMGTKSGENQSLVPRVLSKWCHTDVLNQIVTISVRYFHQGNSVPKILLGASICRAPTPCTLYVSKFQTPRKKASSCSA